MKVLIIEDDKLLAHSIRSRLASARALRRSAVYDGETGAEYAELGIDDLLILDVMMPGMNGYQRGQEGAGQASAAPPF